MTVGTLTLEVLPDRLSICRLDAMAALPEWAIGPGPFVSITRTRDELSIIAPTEQIQTDAALTREDGWRVLKLVGPFALSEVGVLLRVAAPLAEVDVSILAVATFDTDYVVVQERRLAVAVDALRRAGHTVAESDAPATASGTEPRPRG